MVRINFTHDGPCPPPGSPHRYFFKLYALDSDLGLKEGAAKADIEKAMQIMTKILADHPGKMDFSIRQVTMFPC